MTNFDWLSDLSPVHKAQQSWAAGTYQKILHLHIVYPFNAPFCIACGGGMLLEHVRRFKFSPNIIQRLGQVTDSMGRSLFQESFLNHLQRLRLRVQVNMAPEGTLLLPGEPILSIQGPELQVVLLDSALRWLILESTYWATQAAQAQWDKGVYVEEDTPSPPACAFNRDGCRIRAAYIGGADAADGPVLGSHDLPDDWGAAQTLIRRADVPLVQIRRLFKGETPLGDVWLSMEQEKNAGVGHTHIQLLDENNGVPLEIKMSRFQNLLQPLLVKGHPALSSPSLDYLRQRTWKNLEAFQKVALISYPRGWMVA